MLNVRDECDLPEDDGYDLFTRETEVERHRWDELHCGTRCRADDDCESPSSSS
ncbi:MAG: hypothetical protein ABSC64_06075 [Candidatus Korobacteraceae bacterium]|jgi:hypothetical protein